ncbi:multicopper oxidase domain-containing protein [Asanoa iriomotensis]|uniref:multicopper oxidase domain-containing protein n=1 Tax=Asanoa iriomotensis TaxID=234613 RepID=UPI001942AE9F|nr:multicopper oxidase domain-containing protein [Asanoa iriomotensis]
MAAAPGTPGAPPAVGIPVNGSGAGLATAAPGELPEGCAAPDRRIDLYAEELPPDPRTGQVRLGYGLTPETADYPGPTLEMIEGECLALTLYDEVPSETLEALRTDPDQPLGVSVHAHGVKYTPSSDGTAHNDSYVAPGESRTYYWYAKPGTAGYWWYHDHVVGGPHGTTGIGSGLLGGLIVRRPDDVRPDRTYVTAFGDGQTINLRHGPNVDTCDPQDPRPSNTCLVAVVGETVEFVVIGIGNDTHTFHIHGHSWADTRTGRVDSTDRALVDSVRVIDNKTLGPGDSFGVTITAGDSVGPGHWMLHCHMQFHTDAGMSTMLHVLDKNGRIPAHADHH